MDYSEGSKLEEEISMCANTIKCCTINIYNSEDIKFILKERKTLKREVNRLCKKKLEFLWKYYH